MFKSFTLAALAAVAAAQYKQAQGGYGNGSYRTYQQAPSYDLDDRLGYRGTEAAQPAYAVPELNQKLDVSKRQPDRYDDDLDRRGVYGYGVDSDGYDDGYRSSYATGGRRHQNLDLSGQGQQLGYGAVRSDARREDSDLNTDKESANLRHENGDHQNQEYGEKDLRNDDDLDARGLSGLTGGSRRD